MIRRNNFRIDLIKLAGGGRLLRLSDPESGMALEEKLDAERAIVRQREKLLRVFEAALAVA